MSLFEVSVSYDPDNYSLQSSDFLTVGTYSNYEEAKQSFLNVLSLYLEDDDEISENYINGTKDMEKEIWKGNNLFTVSLFEVVEVKPIEDKEILEFLNRYRRG